MEKINIRGVLFDHVTLDEATERAMELAGRTEGETAVIHTPNSEIVQLCIEKPEFYEVINSADIIVPDGSGVVLASKILKTPLTKGKVAGVELGKRIVEESAKAGLGVFFLGGKPGVAETAANNLKSEFPTLIVSGTANGYFKDTDAMIEKINQSGAAVLFVCLGVPKQELWMKENRGKLAVKLAAGLGGSLDVYSGNVKRAPKIFIRLGLEWLYRLLCEPQRIGRMMKLPKFVLGTIFSKKEKA